MREKITIEGRRVYINDDTESVSFGGFVYSFDEVTELASKNSHVMKQILGAINRTLAVVIDTN